MGNLLRRIFSSGYTSAAQNSGSTGGAESVPATWSCPACTFEEDIHRPRCSMCRTEQPVRVQHETWTCPTCTYVESVGRPGCSMCGTERPDEVDPDRPVVILKGAFECDLCYNDEDVGVRLGLCSCVMCKGCARQSILLARDGLPKCPLCKKDIQELDMRKLLTPQEWQQRLARVLGTGERNITSAFHCVTPDCTGWAEVEADGPLYFLCPACRRVTCVPCAAQHEGLTCEQFFRSKQDKEADQQKSKAYFEDLVKQGKAMHCPGCQVVVQKLDGCSYLVCGNPACKMQLCWLTKGPRWGPKGRGDTSGGCRCRVNGRRCHPKCWSCH